MSQKVTGILAALAVSLTVGAVQLAPGHDLTVGLATPGEPAAPAINRAAKADRAAVLPGVTVAATKTISIHVDKVPDTSVLVRVPLAQARSTPPATLFRANESKNAVACEPSV